MKFGKRFLARMVPEWNNAYINYVLLKKLLGPYKEITKNFVKTQHSSGKQELVLIGHIDDDIVELDQFGHIFEKLVLAEIEKMNAFFQFKLMDCMRKWRYIKENTSYIKKRMLAKNFDEMSSSLQLSYHNFYKELKLLEEYAQINQKAIKKLIKKHNKSLKLFDDRNIDTSSSHLKNMVQKIQNESYILRNQPKLQEILDQTQKSYLKFFYSEFNKRQGEKQLKLMYEENVGVNQIHYFYFGLFLGFAIVLLVYIIVWIISDQAEKQTTEDEEHDQDLKKLYMDFIPQNNYLQGDDKQEDVFKLTNYLLFSFRGVSLFILYMWLLAWNVYGWNKYNVNYKLIFKFNHHFSTTHQILKRAAIFTVILLFTFLMFLTLDQYRQSQDDNDFNKYIPIQYMPLVVWACLFGYIFYPSYFIFNGEGRKYFYQLLYRALFTLFYPMEFRISWLTDQAVSFVGPLKDLQQALCFYTSKFMVLNNEGTNTQIEQCYNNNSISTGFIMAFIPLFFRMLQCCRQGYDHGSFYKTEYFWNFGKYTFSALVATFSFVYKNYQYKFYYITWIFFAVSSVFYSFYWDLKYDWGFLQPNSKFKILRSKLSYHNPNIYYMVMVINFFLRWTWVLSISPDTYQALGFKSQGLFTFTISFLEMFRRCLWNFFRVEKEHIKNQLVYKAVEDMSLPINMQEIDKESREYENEFYDEQEIKKLEKAGITVVQVKSENQDDSKIQYEGGEETQDEEDRQLQIELSHGQNKQNENFHQYLQVQQSNLNSDSRNQSYDEGEEVGKERAKSKIYCSLNSKEAEELDKKNIQIEENNTKKQVKVHFKSESQISIKMSEKSVQEKNNLLKDSLYPNHIIVDQSRENFQKKSEKNIKKFNQQQILKDIKAYKKKVQATAYKLRQENHYLQQEFTINSEI